MQEEQPNGPFVHSITAAGLPEKTVCNFTRGGWSGRQIYYPALLKLVLKKSDFYVGDNATKISKR
jgi:hypothetical protein